MLEISRNITRVSKEWGQMTDRSETITLQIQALLNEAQAGIRLAGGEGRDVLESARQEIGTALGALKTAAQCARDNAVKIGELTSGLHDGTNRLRLMSRSLKRLSSNTGEALHEIEATIAAIETPHPPAASSLESLEAECSAFYTTEIERRILRAVLYGEDMPNAGSTIVGNDVELF
jgi:methyl-accepting chemotaxis protein